MAFFDALELQDYETFYSLLDGYASLGLEERPEDSAGRMVLGALRDSYSYRLEGEARVSGDTGVVDSTYGSHVMYYVGDDIPHWEAQVTKALREKASDELAETLSQGDVREGFAMRFVG